MVSQNYYHFHSAPILLQVLGSDRCRLHSFEDQSQSVHHDISRVVCRCCGLTSTAVRLERPRLYATNRAAEMHGLTGFSIPSECILNSSVSTTEKY